MSVEKAPYALYEGCRVAAKASQKEPKVPKTTNGKVLPTIHCRSRQRFESGMRHDGGCSPRQRHPKSSGDRRRNREHQCWRLHCRQRPAIPLESWRAGLGRVRSRRELWVNDQQVTVFRESPWWMEHIQRSRIAKGLSELAGDFILGRKIDLLKQFWRNGQTAGGPNLPQRLLGVHVFVEMVAWQVISPATAAGAFPIPTVLKVLLLGPVNAVSGRMVRVRHFDNGWRVGNSEYG